MGCGGSKSTESTETGSSTVLDKEKESENKTDKTDKKAATSDNDNKATKSMASETKTVKEEIKSNDSEVNCKIIIVGDERVGKTCLLTRFVQNEFIDMYLPTLGAESKSKVLKIDGKSVKLQVSDTSGNERFRTIANAYFRGVNAILIFFDLSDRRMLENLEYWYQAASSQGPVNIAIGLVGTKADLTDGEVTLEEAEAFALKRDMVYAETSARDDKNVDQPFLQVAKKLLQAKETSSFWWKKQTHQQKFNP